jgi:hypothetical protein
VRDEGMESEWRLREVLEGGGGGFGSTRYILVALTKA